MTPDEIKSQLDQFTGTTAYHRVTLGYVCTDGALFLAEQCGCFWFYDLISSYKFEPIIQKQEFLVYKLRVNKDNSANVTAEDGNNNVLIKQEIPYTDFPLDGIDVWVENSVIYLPKNIEKGNTMRFTFIDPDMFDKDTFGFVHKVIACKVASWHGKDDVRQYKLKGWVTIAGLSEIDPRNGRLLKESKWFILCAKGG